MKSPFLLQEECRTTAIFSSYCPQRYRWHPRSTSSKQTPRDSCTNVAAYLMAEWIYGAFSVSISQLDKVTSYIRDQPEHHKKMTFEQEFVALLKRLA
jgi:hypothetical protein